MPSAVRGVAAWINRILFLGRRRPNCQLLSKNMGRTNHVEDPLQAEPATPDQPQANSPEPWAMEDDCASGNLQARMIRVQEYLADSLVKGDHLEANLGSINGGLMRICVSLDEVVHRGMSVSTVTVERIQRLLPAIETYLRLTRQIDRFAQLELRTAAARRPRADPARPAPRPR
jgi:hypothetical protein